MNVKKLKILNKVIYESKKKLTRSLATSSINNNIAGLTGEPKEPLIKTKIPGPRSISLVKELGKFQVNFLKNLLLFINNIINFFNF